MSARSTLPPRGDLADQAGKLSPIHHLGRALLGNEVGNRRIRQRRRIEPQADFLEGPERCVKGPVIISRGDRREANEGGENRQALRRITDGLPDRRVRLIGCAAP